MIYREKLQERLAKWPAAWPSSRQARANQVELKQRKHRIEDAVQRQVLLDEVWSPLGVALSRRLQQRVPRSLSFLATRRQVRLTAEALEARRSRSPSTPN